MRPVSALALRGIWLSLAAIVPQVVTGMVAPLSKISSVSSATTLRSSAKMQYGQQQGYGGQPQGFGGQPQGYGGQPQGYGGQPQGYGAQALWRIYAFSGVCGHSRFSGVPPPRYSSVAEQYGVLPYTLMNGDRHVLGRWNMVQPSPYVSRVQCVVQIGPDGSAILSSVGKPPTGIRSPGGQWMPLYKGMQHVLTNGDQVSLDSREPEGAVFTFQDEGSMQQQGYYGGQQQGYGYGGY